jgi:hypothetical protein
LGQNRPRHSRDERRHEQRDHAARGNESTEGRVGAHHDPRKGQTNDHRQCSTAGASVERIEDGGVDVGILQHRDEVVPGRPKSAQTVHHGIDVRERADQQHHHRIDDEKRENEEQPADPHGDRRPPGAFAAWLDRCLARFGCGYFHSYLPGAKSTFHPCKRQRERISTRHRTCHLAVSGRQRPIALSVDRAALDWATARTCLELDRAQPDPELALPCFDRTLEQPTCSLRRAIANGYAQRLSPRAQSCLRFILLPPPWEGPRVLNVFFFRMTDLLPAAKGTTRRVGLSGYSARSEIGMRSRLELIDKNSLWGGLNIPTGKLCVKGN